MRDVDVAWVEEWNIKARLGILPPWALQAVNLRYFQALQSTEVPT